MEKSLGMSNDKFSFTINEFERLKDLFKKTYEEYYQNFNPYNSFYDLLDDSILDYKKDQFISLISTIYKDYFDKLIELRDRLEKALVGKSTFAFKYLDYIDSDDTTLDQIKKEYLFYSTQIKKINLFSSKFKNQLKAIDLNQKINLIIDTIKQLYTEINQYDRIKKFHSYYLLLK